LSRPPAYALFQAPETPGRYVAYWRLFDGEGCGFGTSVWIDITVAEPSPEDSSSGGSLAASSVIMPHAANPSTTTSPVAERPGVSRASTTTLTDDTFSIAGSDISLVDAPSPLDSDDEDAFRGSRGEEPMEYVVLYEEPASDEE
jgi:next-to-BRCA1 protein 1